MQFYHDLSKRNCFIRVDLKEIITSKIKSTFPCYSTICFSISMGKEAVTSYLSDADIRFASGLFCFFQILVLWANGC